MRPVRRAFPAPIWSAIDFRSGRFRDHSSDRKPRQSRKELQVIVDFGHRPDGGARLLTGVGLLDHDRGRDSGSRPPRLVHRSRNWRVWAEGLDVTALPFRVNRLEGET